MSQGISQPPPPGAKNELPKAVTTPNVTRPPEKIKPQRRVLRLRHVLVALSFLGFVVVPSALFGVYLYLVAADQYISRVGFTVRTEEAGVSSEFLGKLVGVSSASSKDSDILYEFIQSQQLIEQIDQKLDLRNMYSKPKYDPLFAFDPTDSIEDLRDYWLRMVKIYYDSGTGLIELRASGFSPEDARSIATTIFEFSSNMINEISAIAREDSTRYAKVELDKALKNLKTARSNVTQFRARTQIVDPTADVQGQMGLLVNLQAQLADTLIELDLLKEVTEDEDPRIVQATRKVTVIQRRIEGERSKFGLSTGKGDDTFSLLVGQYEALVVDREFAEQSYLAARALYDQALAESGRQSRYLAAYVSPTLAETAEYPRRMLLLTTLSLFFLMAWSILVLIAYSIKDRR
jgi:capsular polysaccharide transport system permease protein